MQIRGSFGFYNYLLRFLFGFFGEPLPIKPPIIEEIMQRARRSQESISLFISNIKPTIQNMRQNISVVNTPQREEQRRASRPLFFFTATNPPKNAEV